MTNYEVLVRVVGVRHPGDQCDQLCEYRASLHASRGGGGLPRETLLGSDAGAWRDGAPCGDTDVERVDRWVPHTLQGRERAATAEGTGGEAALV